MSRVKAVCSDRKIRKELERTLSLLEGCKFRALEVDFFKLDEVLVFLNFNEVEQYQKTHKIKIIDKGGYNFCEGAYEPNRRTIYLFPRYKRDVERIVFVLLHEVSHYIMDVHDIFSRHRYATVPAYRFLEEIRVNNLSYYLGKHILTGNAIYRIGIHTQNYENRMRHSLSLFPIDKQRDGNKEVGICSLMQLSHKLDG